MSKNALRPLAAAGLAVLLLLAPLTAVAAPVEDAPASALPWDGWVQWLARWWPATATESQEALPWVDPDGAAPPPGDGTALPPDTTTSEEPDAGTEAFPWVDPNG